MQFVIILVSIVFSAFFSGMEIAFIASNRLRIELDKKQGTFPARLIEHFTNKPAHYIATMLVGNNISLVIYGIFMAKLLEPAFQHFIASESGILALQTIVSTFLILVTAEFLPKSLFRNNPNQALNIFALPVGLFYVIFYPVTVFTVWLSNTFLGKLFHVEIAGRPQKVIFGKIDLDHFFTENASKETAKELSEEPEIKIFKNALDFSSTRVRDCAIPRTEIVAAEINMPIAKLRQKFIESGHSKILVFKENIDNVIGYFHAPDLFTHPKNIRSHLKEIKVVPETMYANKLLDQFIRESKSIALVVDEFGGTAGVVTIEDLIEEIFGDIQDEHDSVSLIEAQLSDLSFRFSGRLEIDYINEKYHLDIPEHDEYETIAGFILFHYAKIPDEKEEIDIPPFHFIIEKVSETRIEQVVLQITA